jgi:hypothetical protein
MENEQLNEEQLYYKDKYLKYKLKYVTLKEQLEGGFLSSLASIASNLKDKASKQAGKIARNYNTTYNFETNQIQAYLEKYGKDEDKEKLNKINGKDIFNKIKSNLSIKTKQGNTIDQVISKEFEGDEEIEPLRTYVKLSINAYNQHKENIDNFNPETTKQGIEQNCTCHTVIKKNILTKIKNELKKNIILDNAIDAVLNNDKELQIDKENLRSYLKDVIKI